MTSILDDGGLDAGDATGRVTTASSTSTHAASHFHDVFILGEVLGKGAFSTVHKTWHKRSGKEFAVKVLRRENMSDDDVASLVSEVQTQRFIRHPNIVRLVAFFDNDDDNFYLVTELCKGGELFDRIVREERFSEKQAAGHVFVLLDAMHSFHKRHIVHRDIKPENILYSDTRPDALLKIADFGFAVHGGKGESLRSRTGSANYMAPEIIMHKPYGVQVDMWSFGVVTYIMLFGQMPFDHPNERDLFELIKAGRFEFPTRDGSNISADAKNFISKLLVVDPRARLTAEAAMRHPWITKTNLNDVHLVRSVNKLRSFHSKRRASMVRNAFRATAALMHRSGAAGRLPLSAAGASAGGGRRASLAGPPTGSSRSAAMDMAIAASGHGGVAVQGALHPSRGGRRSGMGYRVSPATARTIASTIDEAPPSPVVRMAVNEDPADAESRFNGVLDSPKVFADDSDGSGEGSDGERERAAGRWRHRDSDAAPAAANTPAGTGNGRVGLFPERDQGRGSAGPGASGFVPRRRATSAPEEAELSLVDEAPSTASLLAGRGVAMAVAAESASAQAAASSGSPLAAWTPGGSRRVVAPRFSGAGAPMPPMGSPPGTPTRRA
jgi:serine/threonine protein kinase